MALILGESEMGWIEFLGYLASGAVFAAFWMKTMMALRVIAIAGNALYVAYGLYAGLDIIVALHAALLPLNGFRLYESWQLRERLRQMAHADFDVQSLLGFMTRLEQPRGTPLFRKGDDAHDIFYLLEGQVRIEELGIDIGPGQLVGEIAMFSPERTRTQSVRCMENCLFLKISEEKTLQMYTENPEFGLYLTKMMVARLLANAGQQPEPVVA